MNKDQFKTLIEVTKEKVNNFPDNIMDDAGMELGGMTLKKKYLAFTAISFYLITWTGAAEASFSITHSGSTDPINEGFSVWVDVGSSTVGPVQNDMSHDAWSITGLTQLQQYAYNSAPLTPSQQVDITNQGFNLTVIERVLQGKAPVYTPANSATAGVVEVSTGTNRFDIDLGVDSNGDTVVVLPNSATNSGSSVITPGASYTLTGSGSSYHTYELVYNSTTQLADLSVDGIKRIQDYAGFTYPSMALWSLQLSGINGGQANFSSVQFTSSPVPVPGAIWLFGSALTGFGITGKRRSQKSRV
jgi:hypothetical protein